MTSALVVINRPCERYRAGRTLRAVRGQFNSEPSLVACFEDNEPLAARLENAREPLWILRAGTWPLFNAAQILSTAKSDPTSLPLCAFGMTHFPSDKSHPLIRAHFPTRAQTVLRRVLSDEFGALETEVASWHRVQARTGGDICAGEPFDGELPGVASVLIEPPLSARLAIQLRAGKSCEAALAHVLRTVPARAVRLPQLDVCDDPALRVAQVVTSLQRGGAERLTLDLVDALPSHGTRPFLFALGAPSRGSFVAPDETVEFSSGRNRAERLAHCAEKISALACDVVHAHLLSAADMEAFSARDLPVIATVHNSRPGWPADFERMRGVALLAACARSVEEDVRASDIRVPVRTVWNGINAAQYDRARDAAWRERLEFNSGDFVLLALANPRPQKRLELLPAILKEVQRLFATRSIPRRGRLVIAGEAAPGSSAAQDCVKRIRAECARLELDDDVRLIGAVEHVATLLSSVDALISASAWEGLSLAYLEALASGIPVVATDAGGTRELARENTALTLLSLDAAPCEFAAALVDVSAADGSSRCALSPSFHLNTMAARYASCYPRAINRSSGSKERAGLFLIANNFSVGGAQSSARRLLLGLRTRGIPVQAAVLQERADDPTPGVHALRKGGVRVFIPQPHRDDPLEAVNQIASEIDAAAPRAVVFWNAIAEHKVLLADALLDVPIFDVSPGEMCFDSLERYFARPRPGLPYTSPAEYGARLSGAIVKYRGEVERAERMLGIKACVISNGLPLDEWQPRAERERKAPLIIGTSARLSPQKKLDELIAALRLAAPNLPPHVLRIAGNAERGSGRYADELRELATGLNVEFVGEFRASQEFLDGLDIFVMISEPAGCPNASLEALAAGLPVIATDHGGASEQIIDGKTGRLTPRGNASALAQALLDLAGNSAERARLGKAGRLHVEARFSLERMIDEYCRVCGLLGPPAP